MEKMEEEEFRPPYFEFNDIKLEDLRELDYRDPYYWIRRPIEPERLKTLYQQAFIYDLLYRFAKEHLPDIPDRRDEKDPPNTKSTDTKVDSIKEKVIAYLFSKSQQSVETESNIIKQPSPKVDNDDEEQIVNIWTEDDMRVLRRNWSRIKEENMMLKSRLKSTQDDLEDVREKLIQAKHELEQSPASTIRELEKVNERLYIRVQELESRYEAYSHEFTQTDRLIGDMKRVEGELRARVNTLSTEKCRLEFELNKSRMKSKLLRSEWTSKFEERCESVKLEYLKEINRLKRQLAELNERFNQELADHGKCKKALENLRTHFMSTEFEKVKVNSNCSNSKIDESKIKLF